MNYTESRNSLSRIFLGVDGGQSHTEAIIADESGHILGCGLGGPSNHAEIPGGRERLKNAVAGSVSDALKNANLPSILEVVFTSAHCGMTGGAIYKEEIIRAILQSTIITIGNDAPTALLGATSGKMGIVVIAGTGSIVYGVNEKNETARVGGLGYLFSDEGGGFWLAAQLIRLAIKEHDDLIAPCGLQDIVLDFFGRQQLRELTDDFYNGKISRDEIAGLAKKAHEVAESGHETINEQIKFGAKVLAESVRSVAERLNFHSVFPVAGVGGMFRAKLMKEYLKVLLAENVSQAEFIEPCFNPAVGALILAYRQSGVEINEALLSNLEKSVMQYKAGLF